MIPLLAWGSMNTVPAVPKTDREAILKSGLRLLKASGPVALSLRAIAADLGITPNAIYHHLPNRSALDHALAEEAARRILRSTRVALRNIPTDEALHQFAHIYLRFAAQQAALYDMLMARSGEACDEDERYRLWALLLQLTAPYVGACDAQQAATSLWSLLHGAVTLGRAGMLGETTPQQAVAFGLSAFMKKPR